MKNKNQLVLVLVMLLQVSLSCASSSSQQNNVAFSHDSSKSKKTVNVNKMVSKPVSIFNHEMLPLDKTIPTLKSMLTPLVADQLIKKIEQAIKQNELLEIELPTDTIFVLKPFLDAHRSASNPLLLKAVDKNNESVVACLIKLHMDLEVEDKVHYTALGRASQKGNLNIVKSLMKAGANLDVHSSYYEPITQAVQNGHREIVKELYLNNANVNGFERGPHRESYYSNGVKKYAPINDSATTSPVLQAFKYGYGSIGMDLIENAGADFDKKDHLANTPLIWAARNNDWESVEKLTNLYIKKRDAENAKRKNSESVTCNAENNHSDSVAKKARI